MTVSGCTLSGNTAYSLGGGIASGGLQTISNSTLSGNHAGEFGGGIHNFGSLTIRDSTVLGNNALLGVDVYNVSPGLLFFYDSVLSVVYA